MARPLRLEFPGALYHVTSRGDRREPIYDDDADREAFLEVLARVVKRFRWVIHAWCLMSNHYHVLVETPDANLSRGMRQLNGVYTQYSNRHHGRVGHVFQGRYKAIVVQRDTYLLELARYVVLNPVRARMVRRAGDWPWSSYRAMVGEAPVPEWLTTTTLLAFFGHERQRSRAAYRRFVDEGVRAPSPWGTLTQQVFLGDQGFVDAMHARVVEENRPLAEVPRQQRMGSIGALEDYERAADTRDAAIVQAYASGGYSLQQIGQYFGLHYSRVSRIVRGGEAKRKT